MVGCRLVVCLLVGYPPEAQLSPETQSQKIFFSQIRYSRVFSFCISLCYDPRTSIDITEYRNSFIKKLGNQKISLSTNGRFSFGRLSSGTVARWNIGTQKLCSSSRAPVRGRATQKPRVKKYFFLKFDILECSRFVYHCVMTQGHR